eukprot:Sdes_comp20758_c0_seq2m16730
MVSEERNERDYAMDTLERVLSKPPQTYEDFLQLFPHFSHKEIDWNHSDASLKAANCLLADSALTETQMYFPKSPSLEGPFCKQALVDFVKIRQENLGENASLSTKPQFMHECEDEIQEIHLGVGSRTGGPLLSSFTPQYVRSHCEIWSCCVCFS